LSRKSSKTINRFLILGYTGYGNIGDELMVESAKYFLSQAFNKVKFLFLTPDRGRFNPLNALRTLRESDGVVLCGGNLFQDETSFRSFLYYWMVTRGALFLKRKVFFLNQGLGPLRSKLARRFLKSILSNKRVGGYFRDVVSLRYAVRFNSNFKLCWDTATLVIDDILSPENILSSPTHVCVIPTLKTQESDVITGLKEMKATNVKLVAFQPTKDRNAISRLADGLNKMGISAQIAPTGLKEALSAIKNAEFVITYRLHGALIAAYMGVPFVTFDTAKNRRVIKTMDRNFELFFKDTTGLMIALSRLSDYDFESLKCKYREEMKQQKGIIIEGMRNFFVGGSKNEE